MSIAKISVSGLVAVALFGASIASAQTYYTSYATTGTCAGISTTLSYGSTGEQVRTLQQFLVSQNYPGGGSWMVTGYYGQATAAAVRNFQQSHGLPQTGSVDSATLSAMNTCGGSGYFPGLGGTGHTYQYPFNYSSYYSGTYPYNYTYNYPYNYNSCGTYPYYYPCGGYTTGTAPRLTSLSATSALPGTQVTIYGTGFNASGNTVYVGGTTLSNISSFNGGTALTFTVPSNATGAVSVSVANTWGTSNALTLNSQTQISCGTYPYNNCGNLPYYPCGTYYGSYCPPSTGVPVVTYLSPQQGAVGTSVTVYGSGFSTNGNSVHFGNGVIANLMSLDGRSVSFIVPSSVSGYGYQPIGLGTYDVSVSNAQGQTSNSMPFTVTSLGTSGAPTISNVSGPTSLSLSQSGTWTVTVQNTGNSYLSTSVNWGDSSTYGTNAPQTTYASGQTTLSFSHAYSSAGTYTITFTVSNQYGQQNTSSVTVYVSGSNNGTISLSSINPSSGRVGTQVVITGSNFGSDNTVHFGVGGTMHVPSYNGTTIYYTIPSYLSPCDVQTGGGVCAQYIQPVTPGTYQLYVTNGNATSQTLTFTVVQ